MSVILKKSPFPGIESQELAQQIESKKKAINKLPTWYNRPKIYYPLKLNLEQTSSETTAQYKADLVSGNNLLDLTGGFGVDSFFFSKVIKKVMHCETNAALSEMARWNFTQLNALNIDCKSMDGISFLEESKVKFDWIYIDPSRRDHSKKRVYFLQDCEPDVTQNLALFWEHTDNILIKTAPLLDLSMGLRDLEHVSEIHVVAVENDVKELLWILKKNHTKEPVIKTVNFAKNGTETFEFSAFQEQRSHAVLGVPETYLYEPNGAILKAGAFKTIGQHYGLKKLQEHSHLYTSNELVAFPGRRFKIESEHPYSKKEIKKIGLEKANITIRNFPETVANIRKKTGLKDGGEHYLFFTKNMDQKPIVLVTTKA